ncbi:MAG: glycogen synthase [Chlamydiota bacterium]|nr:glycogen synthase [Chlamydiota bacterium]
MDIVILTNEYPPYVYGGAGVHVEYLTRELSLLQERTHHVRVFSFGNQNVHDQNLDVTGVDHQSQLSYRNPRHKKLMDTLLRDILMAGSIEKADIVHCHTWYTHFAGCLLKQLTGAKLVLTTHSLEPHRPWKSEQLGTAYHASTWLEKTAYQNADGVIAVSESMKRDVELLYEVPQKKVKVIHNGIDLAQYKPTPNPILLKHYNINTDLPYILFVGRITRQKGIIHLVNAIKYLRHDVQIVLCAGAPDTEEIGREMNHAVDEARSDSSHHIIWIDKILPKSDLISLYTHASIFICPSVYEPFGIINLEAMACETPIVASNVGGIPEVVVHNESGILVNIKTCGKDNTDLAEPEQFSKDLAEAVNRLIVDPVRLRQMALASRSRVEKHFSWTHIARETFAFYESLMPAK